MNSSTVSQRNLKVGNLYQMDSAHLSTRFGYFKSTLQRDDSTYTETIDLRNPFAVLDKLQLQLAKFKIMMVGTGITGWVTFFDADRFEELGTNSNE